MTKFFKAVLALVCFCSAASAQTKNSNEFGVQIGLNGATVHADGITNSSYRVGFNAGVSIDHYFSESWSLKAKLIYDQKGWDNGYVAFDNLRMTTDYSLNYLTIPVLANWHFGRTKNWYLNFGPYASILLSASEVAGGTDLKPYMASPEMGLDLGIGVKIPVSDKARFFIEFNGQGGISDLFKDNSGSTIRSSVSALNIGINF
ncbi:PorT family protein [Mucilaginibacter sp. JRF]|uniref:porin family protein n=1 Tax=Mucilaginibacter sp. JRF TaxID=2780088 RepID=UPI00187E7080|nr:porin family protein [Mucilaginibacter sp. JRF]MBE9585194.1 PorT family protein [Mucilaginibacter sp. JRF]